jgi:Tfp pilus assembly protein FimT
MPNFKQIMASNFAETLLCEAAAETQLARDEASDGTDEEEEAS